MGRESSAGPDHDPQGQVVGRVELGLASHEAIAHRISAGAGRVLVAAYGATPHMAVLELYLVTQEPERCPYRLAARDRAIAASRAYAASFDLDSPTRARIGCAA